MSRTEKLYEELEGLEREFCGLLARELELVRQGRHSHYLYSRAARYPEGRTWKAAETSHMERLERKIARLRDKLGASGLASATDLAREFAERKNASGTAWWHGQGQAIAKELLERVGKL